MIQFDSVDSWSESKGCLVSGAWWITSRPVLPFSDFFGKRLVWRGAQIVAAEGVARFPGRFSLGSEGSGRKWVAHRRANDQAPMTNESAARGWSRRPGRWSDQVFKERVVAECLLTH